jgi:hypothetical protein
MTPRPCGGFVGFLLPRPCPNAAVGDCSACGRATCEEHARVAQAGLLCTACESGSKVPIGLAAVAAAAGLAPFFLPSDLLAFEDAGLGEDEGEEGAAAAMFADLS